MDEDKIFMALCKDNLDDPPFIFTVYLVNQTDEKLNAKMSSWGFVSDDEDLITTTEAKKEFVVAERNYVKVENDDWASFDFTTNFFFTITYGTSNEVEKKVFTIPKYLWGLKIKTSIPVLNKQGYPILSNKYFHMNRT